MGLSTQELGVVFKTKDAKKVTVNASDVMKKLASEMTDTELMREYKLSPADCKVSSETLQEWAHFQGNVYATKSRLGKISTSRH